MAEDPPRLGPFELTGRLGEGGQGIVYLGRGPHDEQVAVKLLHHGLAGDPEARTRFLREVSVAQRVARFCTAPVLHADLAGSRPYIVSEYVSGPSLRLLVEREGPRRGAALERLAISTATALSAIHRAGVLHRDFKPANVLMGPEGPVVIDFGIARALDSPGVTSTGATMGTPSYLAPEQLNEGEVTAAADVFAWGVTMVFAATGRPAFGADSIPVVMNRILTAEPELSGLEGPLRRLVAASLSKDPALRPVASELVDQLTGATSPSPPRGGRPVSPPADPASPRRPALTRRARPTGLLLAGVATVAALGVAAGTVVVLQGDEKASSTRAAARRDPSPAPTASALVPVPAASSPSSSGRPRHTGREEKLEEKEESVTPTVRITDYPGPERPARPSSAPTFSEKPGRHRGGSVEPGGESPEPKVPVEPPVTDRPTPRPTVKPTPKPTVKPTVRPSPTPTVKPTVKPSPPPPKPNPYTAAGVCGRGYRVVGSRPLGGAATVYLLHNFSAGRKCVVTMSKYVIPGKIKMSATLQVKGGPSGGDAGRFTVYAGPVRLVAAKKCVIWGGTHGALSWKSAWGHCG